MKKGMVLTLGLVGAGLTIYSVYLYNQYLKLYKGNFKVVGIKNLIILGNKISFTLLTTLKNSGDLSARVKDQDYQVFVNGNPISKVKNNDEIKIISNGISVIPFYIEVDLNDLIKQGQANIVNILLDKSKVKFDLKGYFTWSAGLIKRKEPFSLTYTLKEIIDLNKKTTPTAATAKNVNT
jgi:hypothetical protein